MRENIYADLPRVVEILDLKDYGEYGAVSCPHCGAQGRYIYFFTTDNGQSYGAMKGCFRKFPKSPYADRMAKLLGKEKEFKAKKWKLASWDQDSINAIRAYGEGKILQKDLDRILAESDRAKYLYMKKKGYR